MVQWHVQWQSLQTHNNLHHISENRETETLGIQKELKVILVFEGQESRSSSSSCSSVRTKESMDPIYPVYTVHIEKL